MPSRSRNKIVSILNIKAALKGKKILHPLKQGSVTSQSSRRTSLRKLFWTRYDINLDRFIKPDALLFLTSKVQVAGAMPVLTELLIQKKKLPEPFPNQIRRERERDLERDPYHYKKFRDIEKRQTDGRQYLV